jgi:hypothetical protein
MGFPSGSLGTRKGLKAYSGSGKPLIFFKVSSA